MGHLLVRCRRCRTIIQQCRCPASIKSERLETCARCQRELLEELECKNRPDPPPQTPAVETKK